MSTIIVGAIVFCFVGLAVGKMILDRKRNVSTCGGGCKGCASSDICHQK